MNDFLFLIAVENLRPRSANRSDPEPWFSVVPNEWRFAVFAPLAKWIGTDPPTAGFVATRGLSLAAFGLCLLALCRRVVSQPTRRGLVHACFLCVAAFWLLAPTQNPWYWAWAMPFAALGANRWWLAGPPIAMAYYLRFWLSASFPDTQVLATPYTGVAFYDFVVVPCLDGTWLVLLACGGRRSRNRGAVPRVTEGGGDGCVGSQDCQSTLNPSR